MNQNMETAAALYQEIRNSLEEDKASRASRGSSESVKADDLVKYARAFALVSGQGSTCNCSCD